MREYKFRLHQKVRILAGARKGQDGVIEYKKRDDISRLALYYIAGWWYYEEELAEIVSV